MKGSWVRTPLFSGAGIEERGREGERSRDRKKPGQEEAGKERGRDRKKRKRRKKGNRRKRKK